MRARHLLVILAAVSVAQASAQGDPGVIAKVLDESHHRSRAVANFRHLTKKIGARLTGGQTIIKAQKWVASEFQRYGLSSVQLEKYGSVPIGFERGKGSYGRMVLPFECEFQISSPAWSPGTNGPVRAEAILEPQSLEELKAVKKDLAGKWLIQRRSVGMRSGRRGGGSAAEEERAVQALQAEIDQSGIVGRVTGDSADELVHTHGSWRGITWDNLPKGIRVSVRGVDHRKIVRSLTVGEKVVLEFNLDQRFVKGEVPLYNVFAEIPGTEKPDELVVVGAHIDSWDGPGSEGASDNGTGTITTLEAARLLAAAGAKPKRTIRFVLFSGEEQGLLGSAAHVKALGDRAAKVSAMFCEDSGSNPHTSIAGLAMWEPYLTRALSDYNKAFPEKPIQVSVVEQFRAGGGSDHASFAAVGIPAFFWRKSGPQNYMRIWHTQLDTFEEAIPENVRQMALNTALTAYNIACADSMLPRPQRAQPSRPSD